MPKGENFRKYDYQSKLDDIIAIRINSTELKRLREIEKKPQNWIRGLIE